MSSAVPSLRPAPVGDLDDFPLVGGPAAHWRDDPYLYAALLGARDPVTGEHLGRVGQIAHLFAEEIGLTGPEVGRVALGGYLHDIGKLQIPDRILKKPSKLAADEDAVMRTHPELGNGLLGDHPVGELVRAAVLYHHEMPNGQGYPYGLRADQIPLDAKMVGLVDAFDAMTSDRPYRRRLPLDRVLAILEGGLGTQFDAELGARFLGLVRSGAVARLCARPPRAAPVLACASCGPTMLLRWDHPAGRPVFCPRCGAKGAHPG